MADRRIFFVVLTAHGQPSFALHCDQLPTKTALAQTLGQVAYRRELTGTKWAAMQLSEIVAEYQRRAAAGTLPPENIAKAAPDKTREEHRLRGYREKRVSSREIAEAAGR